MTGPTRAMTAMRDGTKGQPVGRGGRRAGRRPKEEDAQKRVDGGASGNRSNVTAA